MSINRNKYNLEQNFKTSTSNSDFLNTSFGYPTSSNTNFLASPVSINSAISMDRESSPNFLEAPLIQSLQPLKRQSSKNGVGKLQKRVSIKDVFKNRKQNISLDELAQVQQNINKPFIILAQLSLLCIYIG